VNLISDARIIKIRISRYGNGAYTPIQFLRLQATALELTMFLCMKPAATQIMVTTTTNASDAGEEVIEAPTADDSQQNDFCEVYLVISITV